MMSQGNDKNNTSVTVTKSLTDESDILCGKFKSVFRASLQLNC